MTAADVAFLKDFGDMVRGRTMFFFPFYGAFITFLFAKSQYVLDASTVIHVLSLATFLAGVSYAYTVARLISRIEEIRLIMDLRTSPMISADPVFSTDEQAALLGAVSLLVPSHGFEKRHFKWSMYMLWATTGTVLMDVFLKGPETAAFCFVALHAFHTHCGK